MRLPAKLESDWSKTNGDIVPHMHNRGILPTIVWWWGEGAGSGPPPPHHNHHHHRTNVRNISWFFETIYSLCLAPLNLGIKLSYFHKLKKTLSLYCNWPNRDSLPNPYILCGVYWGFAQAEIVLDA